MLHGKVHTLEDLDPFWRTGLPVALGHVLQLEKHGLTPLKNERN
jgi:hypothetical protein